MADFVQLCAGILIAYGLIAVILCFIMDSSVFPQALSNVMLIVTGVLLLFNDLPSMMVNVLTGALLITGFAMLVLSVGLARTKGRRPAYGMFAISSIVMMVTAITIIVL